MRRVFAVVAFLIVAVQAGKAQAISNLRRMVALRLDENRVFLSWRMLKNDSDDIVFRIYRSQDGGDSFEVIGETNWLNYIDNIDISKVSADFVVYKVEGLEGEGIVSVDWYSLKREAPIGNYISIPIRDDLPYGARLVAAGDLNGDGRYDFVVKRGNLDIDPSQSSTWDESQTYKLEAYRDDGTFLWRFDMGINVRPGIWYSPFVVYDINGDGKAEVCLRAGEINEDWNGDGRTDYRDAEGRILSGPEYLIVLNGETGEIMARVPWIPRGNVTDWGDNYGNRSERHMLAIAYLDGIHPSIIALRGTYTKMVAEAWDWKNDQLIKRWHWEKSWGGGGFHNYRIGDIDEDRKDEIVNGSIAIDDDGTTLWDTGQGHGDRMHMADIDPDHPGLEIWYVYESPSDYDYPVQLRDAKTGELLWGKGDDSWGDVGRGLAADIDPRFHGMELWASRGDLYNAKGARISSRPLSVNFAIYWDDDLMRELLDGNKIYKWNWENSKQEIIFEAEGNVGSRNAPMGYGDILGDWREEMWFTLGNKELRIYISPTPTNLRLPSFMDDRMYRLSVVSQAVGYMQATQCSFYPRSNEGTVNVVNESKEIGEDAVLYPNPVFNGKLYIKSKKGSICYSIWNILGQTMSRRCIRGNVIDMSNISSGIYFIKIDEMRKYYQITILK